MLLITNFFFLRYIALSEELVLMDKLECRCICVGLSDGCIDVYIWFLYLDLCDFVL